MPYLFVFLAVINFVVFGYFKFIQQPTLSADSLAAKESLPLVITMKNTSKL